MTTYPRIEKLLEDLGTGNKSYVYLCKEEVSEDRVEKILDDLRNSVEFTTKRLERIERVLEIANRIESGEDVESGLFAICHELTHWISKPGNLSTMYEALSELSTHSSVPTTSLRDSRATLDNALLETIFRSAMKSTYFPPSSMSIRNYRGTLWFLFFGENPTAPLYMDSDPWFRASAHAIYSSPSPTTMCRSVEREVAKTTPLSIATLKVFEQFLRERFGANWEKYVSWWIGLPPSEPGTRGYDAWTRDLFLKLIGEGHRSSTLTMKQEFVLSITGKEPSYSEKTKKVSLRTPPTYMRTYSIDWYVRGLLDNKLDPLLHGTNIMVEPSEMFTLSVMAARFWTNFAKTQGVFLPPHPLQYLFEED